MKKIERLERKVIKNEALARLELFQSNEVYMEAQEQRKFFYKHC